MSDYLIRKDDHRGRHVAALAGGTGVLGFAAANKAPEAIEGVRQKVQNRRYAPRLAALGTTGYLDDKNKPYTPHPDEFNRPQKRKVTQPDGRVFVERPKYSPAKEAELRHRHATEALTAARDKPLLNAAMRHRVRWGTTRGGLILGGAGVYYGARQLASKAVTRRDVDAAAAGATAGGLAYAYTPYAWTRGPARRLERKVNEDPVASAKVAEARLAAGVRPNTPRGEGTHVEFNRHYPDVPGGRAKRILARTHGGVRGILATAGASALTAGGFAHHQRKTGRIPGEKMANRVTDVAQQGARGAKSTVSKGRVAHYVGNIAEEASRRASVPLEEALNRSAAGAQQRLNRAVRVGDNKRSVKLGLAAVAGIGGGITAGSAGQRIVDRRRQIIKSDYDLFPSPQYSVGIPAARNNPISPLAMAASSAIMADAMAGAMGRRLSKRKRARLHENAFDFTAARGMLYSPLGHGQVTTG